MRFKSLSFRFAFSHRADCSIASVRLAAEAPIAVRSKSRLAAGVKLPAASARRGVHEGGSISPLFPVRALAVLDWPMPGVRPNRPALARRLFDALFESLWEMTSRCEIAGRWNDVFKSGPLLGSSSGVTMRGVAFRVPHVINCFTAAGPSSDAVGDGMLGTREKSRLPVGDLGRSGTK